VPAASKVLFATLTLSNQGIDETVLRVVGGIGVASDQSAASELQIGAIGMCLATDTAIAAGVASLPDPVTDASDDIWFMYQSWAQEFIFGTAVGLAPDMRAWYPFDQKAKRIVHSGFSIAVVVANAHASHGFSVIPMIRMLTMVRGTR